MSILPLPTSSIPQHLITIQADISEMFGYQPSRRRRNYLRRNSRRNRPQSFNQRRLAQEYDSIHFNNRIRNQQRRQQDEQQVEIQLSELSSAEPLPISSSERTSTIRSNNQRPINMTMSAIQREQGRRRRDLIRAELMRLIAANTYDNQRNLNSAILLRNLQMLQLSTLARDFNENDYEMLSSLDVHQRSFASERQQFMIAQLPTYQFKSKSSPTKGEDEQNFQQQNIEQNQDEKIINERNQCSICIEQFVDDETIKLLPCFHQFHSQCIDDWLLRKSLCPVCKHDIDASSQEMNE